MNNLRKPVLFITCAVILLLSGPLSAQSDIVTVHNIRISVNDNTTRVVLDADKPVPFNAPNKTETHRLEVDLPGVSIKSLPDKSLFSNSGIADIEFVPTEDGKSTKLKIFLRQRRIISIKPYAPKNNYGHRLVLDFIKLNKVKNSAPKIATPKKSEKTTDQLFIEGQKALAAGEFRNALSIYQRLAGNSNADVRQKALEFFAVSLELSGKKARAKLEYENYIKAYPDTEGALRVQQRLDALLSLESSIPTLKSSSRKIGNKPQWETWGLFIEDYRWSETVDDQGTSDTRLSSAYSILDVNARYRTSDWEISTRLNGGYEADFLDSEDSRGNLNYLYAYGEHLPTESSIKLGRQRQRTGGTIGRFDGVSISSAITDTILLNVIAGFPVERSTDTSVNTERSFYGINAEIGPFYQDLDLNFFYIDQEMDGFTDREAVGGEIKYFNSNYYLSGYVDYDIHFNELNALLLNSRYSFSNGTDVSLSLNFRKSPYLTTKNALIGQQVDDLSELQDDISGIDSLEELALDRTFDSTSLNFNINHPISDSIDLNTSITVSELSDTPSSAGVIGFEGTDTEYYINNQLLIDSLLVNRDMARFGVTYASLTHSDIYSLYTHYQIPVSDKWRLYPRIAFQQRDNHNDSSQDRYSLLLRSEYRFTKNHRLDGQIGADLYINNNQFQNEDEFTIYYFNLGYTYLF